jgi:superfamily II DNA or RNA helicase
MNKLGFLRTERLLSGPWQAFERDVARLLLHNNFYDVRVVGKTGDKGADIVGENASGNWVVQCKHTTTSYPPKAAIDEVLEAGSYYKADHLSIAASRPAGDAFLRKRNDIKNLGLDIKFWGPDELAKLFSNASTFPSTKKDLRDYQREAVESFRNALVDTGKGQIVLATGLGKTVVMASTVQEFFESDLLPNRRVLVLAHMKELVNQLHSSFWNQISKYIPTHQLSDGEFPTFWEGITFATFQSVINNIDDLPEFDLVLVDEAHHIGAETFRRVLDELSPKMLGGVTATPWRGDGYLIDEIIGPSVFSLGIADGLAKGFLSEVDYRIFADNVDWNLVQDCSKNKYSLGQLNRKLIIPLRDDQAARIISDLFQSTNRTAGIIFCPSIAHARHFSTVLREYGLTCEIIASDIDSRECALNLARFRKGLYQLAITIDMFNEGVDVPDVDMIVFMRSTHSRRIFIQQLGRGLRISDAKDKVLVMDFVSELRRMAEIVELDRAVKSLEVEKVGLGRQLIQFDDKSSGSFMYEWLLDQADLENSDSSTLEIPQLDFPSSELPGSSQ